MGTSCCCSKQNLFKTICILDDNNHNENENGDINGGIINNNNINHINISKNLKISLIGKPIIIEPFDLINQRQESYLTGDEAQYEMRYQKLESSQEESSKLSNN